MDDCGSCCTSGAQVSGEERRSAGIQTPEQCLQVHRNRHHCFHSPENGLPCALGNVPAGQHDRTGSLVPNVRGN